MPTQISKDNASGTRQLARLCAGYFICYVGTGLGVKYFTEVSPHPMSQLAYLVQNTAGSSVFVITLLLLLGWHRLAARLAHGKRSSLIALSGLCTAVVIPTTTLMYLLPISVMVAMVIMRGSVILISRMVDAIQIRQGILKKKITWEENWAALFGLLAVGMNLLSPARGADRLDFIHSPIALTILGAYLAAYSVRLYIMNLYKNGRAGGAPDNRAFFTLEQFWASAAMLAVGGALIRFTSVLGPSVLSPRPWAITSGLAYGGVAFFSVFIFMFPGRSATFAGVANRLTSLTAGTLSTLLLALWFGKSFPTLYEWGSLFWIGIATALLIRVELSRSGSKPRATPAPAPRGHPGARSREAHLPAG